jgi:hypothetical protein
VDLSRASRGVAAMFAGTGVRSWTHPVRSSSGREAVPFTVGCEVTTRESGRTSDTRRVRRAAVEDGLPDRLDLHRNVTVKNIRSRSGYFTLGPGSRTAGIAMARKLIEAAQSRWRGVNAPS